MLPNQDSIWNKVSNSMKKEFDIEPSYIKKISENRNKALRL